jgi:hypothetical protein
MKKLRDMIDEQFPDLTENISVSFDTQPMPIIVLEGLIPTYEQKLELSRFVRRAFRDLTVVNNLRVRRVYEGEKSFYVANSNGDSAPVRVLEPQRRVREKGSEVAAVSVRKSDAEIATQLGAALRADPIIKNCNIELRVDDGVAWLAGRVESPGQKVRAIRLASVQPGVRYVVNQLDIRPPSDEPSGITVRIPEPDDVVVYVERYISTRMPELGDADVQITDNSLVVAVPDSDWTDAELLQFEARLRRLPELKGIAVSVRPERVERRRPAPEQPVPNETRRDQTPPSEREKKPQQKRDQEPNDQA